MNHALGSTGTRVSTVGSQTPNYRTWCLRFPLNLTFHLKTLEKLELNPKQAEGRKQQILKQKLIKQIMNW